MRGVNATALIVTVVLPVLFIGLFAITASRADSEILTGLTPGSFGNSAQAGNPCAIPNARYMR